MSAHKGKRNRLQEWKDAWYLAERPWAVRTVMGAHRRAMPLWRPKGVSA